MDVWAETHTPTDPSYSNPGPEDAINQYGVTADNPLNSYSAGKNLDTIAQQYSGKRLDYILYCDPVDS